MKKKKNPNQIIPNKVKEFREEKTFNKHELAVTASISYPTICNMEKGKPTRKDCRLKVAKALGKRYEEVFPNDTD